MPLDDLELYGSGSTTNSDSAESDVDANRPQGKADCNATEAELENERTDLQKFDEQPENSLNDEFEYSPAQKSSSCSPCPLLSAVMSFRILCLNRTTTIVPKKLIRRHPDIMHVQFPIFDSKRSVHFDLF